MLGHVPARLCAVGLNGLQGFVAKRTLPDASLPDLCLSPMNSCRWLCCVVCVLISAAACKEPPAPAKRQAPIVPVIKSQSRGPAPLRTVEIKNRPLDPGEISQFRPLPAVYTKNAVPLPVPLVELGRTLFHEERLSKNHDFSCNSCHALDSFGVDGETVSTGHLGQRGKRNAPTVYNAAGQSTQFWDGRERTVEDQAIRPILDPTEMAMDEARVLATLKSMPGYVTLFKEAFPEEPDPITFANVGKALGAFERTLVTPARWDSYLIAQQAVAEARRLARRNGATAPGSVPTTAPASAPNTAPGTAALVAAGGAAATASPASTPAAGTGGAAATGAAADATLTAEEQLGFLTFYEVGCPSCHDGPLLGGNLFEKLGRVRPWPNLEDTGRGQLTGREDQHMSFKVASLRNIEKTGPYFHDASSSELEDAVTRMALHQLGVTLKKEQASAIVAWLKTLTGNPTAEMMREPKLPKSTATTPTPDPT